MRRTGLPGEQSAIAVCKLSALGALLLVLSGCVVYDEPPYPVAAPVYYAPSYGYGYGYGGYGYGYGYAPSVTIGGWGHYGHGWGGRGWR